MAQYRVKGKVTASVDGQLRGIAGMSVQLMLQCPNGDLLVAEQLTRADGTTTISFEAPDAAQRTDGSVRIREVIKDRDGVIVDKASRARSVKRDEIRSFSCRVDNQRIANHLSQPLHVQVGSMDIDRAALEGDVDRGISSFAAPGTPQFNNFRAAALCPGPPIDLLDELIQDSIQVLEGDPRVAERFADTLEVIIKRQQAVTGNPATTSVQNSTPAQIQRNQQLNLPDTSRSQLLNRVLDNSPSLQHIPGSQPIRTLVPREQGAMAMAAAVHIAGNDASAAMRNLDGVLQSICGLEELGAIRQIGLDGLSNPRSATRLRGFLGARGGEWGPDDGPPIGNLPGIPCDPFIIDHARCARDIVAAIRNPVPSYTINDVQPQQACPGETIEIIGSDFTDEPGKVEFRGRGGSFLEVDADLWEDKRIVVTVPANASCGIKLRIYVRTQRICDRFQDIFRRGIILTDFIGGAADITRFTANGRNNFSCVKPGEVLSLRWDTCAATSALFELRDHNNDVVATSTDLNGLETVNISASAETSVWRSRVSVEGKCSPGVSTETIDIRIEPEPDLIINGIEVTQSIQHYRANEHLQTSVGADNSLPLVVGKMAWVRVYLRSGIDSGFNEGELEGVSGRVTLSRIVGGAKQLLADLSPLNAPVVARSNYPTYRAERGAINSSLNFQIPANQMTGRLVLEVSVNAEDSCYGLQARDKRTLEIDVAQRNRLRLRGVPFSFDPLPMAGSTLTAAAAPTVAQFRTDAALAYAHWPVAAMRNSDATMTAVQSTTLPLNDPRSRPGGCSPNWGALLTALDQAATNDGSQTNTIYYGYLPATIPVAVPGCGRGGRGAARQGDTFTMTHEIGHGIGRGHSPCGNTPGDNNYPVYLPYDAVVTPISGTTPNLSLQMASIGEYGLDIRNGQVFDPNVTSDLMSYCGPSWISKYVHNLAFNAAVLNPTAVPVGAPGPVISMAAPETSLGDSNEPERLIIIWGNSAVGDVTVSSVVRLTSVKRDGAQSDLTAELLDENGTVLSAAPAVALENHGGCGCGSQGAGLTHGGEYSGEKASFDFRADLVDVATGHQLRIRRDEDILWVQKRASRLPRISKVAARVRRDGKLEVKWDATVGKDTICQAWISCTAPDGSAHQGLAACITGNSQIIDITPLAGGKAVIKVVISDGFACASSTSKTIDVPGQADEVVILYPQPDSVLPCEGALCLLGITSDHQDNPLESCEWMLDGKSVGDEQDVTIPMPKPGKHRIEFKSGKVSQRVQFVVAPHPAHAEPDNL